MEIKTIEDINGFKELLRGIIIKHYNARSCSREEWLKRYCQNSIFHRITRVTEGNMVKLHTLLYILKGLEVYITVDGISSIDAKINDIHDILLGRLKQKIAYLHETLPYTEIEMRYSIPTRRISTMMRNKSHLTGKQISIESLMLFLAAINKLITVEIEELK